MNYLVRISPIFISIFILSCNHPKKALPESDKVVMMTIFPLLIDSMFVEISFEMTPPPVSYVMDSSSGEQRVLFADKDQKLKNEIRQKLNRSKYDSLELSVVIDDTIRSLEEEELKEFPHKRIINRASLNLEYKIDYKSIINCDEFKIILTSGYNPNSELEPYKQALSKFTFSRIVFNEQCNYGMLTCKYNCGLGCGLGYRIFINKDEYGWSIDKITLVYIV